VARVARPAAQATPAGLATCPTSMHSDTRRGFLKQMGVGATMAALSAGRAAAAQPGVAPQAAGTPLTIDPQPRFALSPYLYMQFMEPLGVTDSSVAAAWDFGRDCWREDVLEVTRELAPTMIRWGGCFASYYRWKEGVGPRDQRRPMLNLSWGGVETNDVGTPEFVDFCRQAGAEPLICINFESDGKTYFARTPKGDDRLGTAAEAAEWVRYCNAADSPARRRHGRAEPLGVRFWQIGNETSYGPDLWDCEMGARKTVEFAQAMRRDDPTIKLIGWGDSGWGPRMLEVAGEHLDYLAFHHMFSPDEGQENSPLRGIEYRKDPARTWDHLMAAHQVHERRIADMRAEVAAYPTPLAMTECHFALPGRNRCEVLSTWAAGVANARLLNVHERHGDRLHIATAADFCGTRWQVNALMIPVPGGRPFLMPVAIVMSLYRHHTGEQAVSVTAAPDGLDVTASRTGDRLYLHVVNTRRTDAVAAELGVEGMRLAGGAVYELATDPGFEVFEARDEVLVPVRKDLPPDGRWTFPAASVSAVELDLQLA